MEDQPFWRRLSASWFVVLFMVLSVLYFVMIPLPRADGHLIGSDGGYYFSYMRSFWIDHDFDIHNDVVLYNARMTLDNPNRMRVLYDRSIGPSLLWSPFFLFARALVLSLSACGFSIATDGFSYLEEAAVCLGSILYVVLGLYALFVTVSRYVPRRISLASVFLMFMSTFAFYYALFEPSMGHALELGTVSFFLWAILGRDEMNTARAWMLVGIVGGLMTLVRWQNVVFLILVPYGMIRSGQSFSRMLSGTTTCGIVFLAVTAVQGVFWNVVFGKVFTIPQGESFMTPGATHFREVLFSTRHGLISWHPVFIFAALGMIFVRPRGTAAVLSLLVLLQLYVCSIVSEWWCADSFGMRRMTGTIPMLTFGLAFLLNRASAFSSGKRLVVASVAVALVLWNLLFMAQYRLGMISPGSALTFRQMTTEKLQVFEKGYKYFEVMP